MSLFNHIPITFQQAQLIEKDNQHFYQTPTGDIFPINYNYTAKNNVC